MPSLMKRNNKLQEQFIELAMLKEPPLEVALMLLVGAILTHLIPEAHKNKNGRQLAYKHKEVL